MTTFVNDRRKVTVRDEMNKHKIKSRTLIVRSKNDTFSIIYRNVQYLKKNNEKKLKTKTEQSQTYRSSQFSYWLVLRWWDEWPFSGTLGDFTFWISLSLRPNFGLRPNLIQKEKSPTVSACISHSAASHSASYPQPDNRSCEFWLSGDFLSSCTFSRSKSTTINNGKAWRLTKHAWCFSVMLMGHVSQLLNMHALAGFSGISKPNFPMKKSIGTRTRS